MDININYIEKGSGEPLILLHGNGEDSSYFNGQLDAFARYFHVYALDTRGHGKTPRGTAPFTIRQFADDLLAFMDAHEIAWAHLLGYRFAKLFARRSAEARQHAELLGLMVNDPAVRPEELAGIQAPTLVVAGTRDMIKEQHTRLIAASIPSAQLVILDGDHFVANKRPAAFNEAVLDFLRCGPVF